MGAIKICLLLLLLQCSTEINGLQCSDCLHVGTKFINMPSFMENLMNSLMESLQLSNPACKNNTITTTTCEQAGFGEVNKCTNLVITVDARGLTNIAPDGSMYMEVVTRGCEARPSSEGDVCNDISTVADANSQAQFMASLERLTERFDTVTYNGQVCYGRDIGAKPTTTRPTTTRPTERREPVTDDFNRFRSTPNNDISSANTVIISRSVLSACLWVLLFYKMF